MVGPLTTPGHGQTGAATRRCFAALMGVTMSLKKLAAGPGYAYLTEQVAAFDSTELGRTPLADYYAAKGEEPGLESLDGEPVTEGAAKQTIKELKRFRARRSEADAQRGA